MKVHLDTDIGGDPDDLCALALLLASPDVEIMGITTVCEDGGRRAGYARQVLRLAGREEIPVAAGATEALHGPWRASPDLPDEAEYWPAPVEPHPGSLDDAIALLHSSVMAGATVISIGPPTNLAHYIHRHPGWLATVPLVVMGGYIVGEDGSSIGQGLPQWGAEFDWNLNLDVAATRVVLEGSRPTIVPINTTLKAHLRVGDLPRLRAAGPLGELMARQAPLVFRDRREALTAHAGIPDDILNFHHDPLACAVALGWEGAQTTELPLAVEYDSGFPIERIVDPAEGVPYPVLMDVDGPAFSRWWLDRVTGTD